MAHVVIIGASTGGLPADYDIQQTLGNIIELRSFPIQIPYSPRPRIPGSRWAGFAVKTRLSNYSLSEEKTG